MKLPPTPPPFALQPAPGERAFRFANGAEARSLREFAERLETLPVDVAWFHREHFAPWLRHVVGDDPLARRVEAYAQAGGDPVVFQETLRDLCARRLAQLAAAPAA